MTEPRVEAAVMKHFGHCRCDQQIKKLPPCLYCQAKASLRGESAMNAQERELDQLLPDSLNRPMSERIQGLKERADREAKLAVELREALEKVAAILQGCDLETDYYLDSRRRSQRYVKQQMIDWLAEAERLLAERGEGTK